MIDVETHNQAIKHKFIGSPSIQVDNKDIFPTKHNNYDLGCRVYQTPQGIKGLPTEEMIRTQVEKFLKQ